MTAFTSRLLMEAPRPRVQAVLQLPLVRLPLPRLPLPLLPLPLLLPVRVLLGLLPEVRLQLRLREGSLALVALVALAEESSAAHDFRSSSRFDPALTRIIFI